MSAKLYGSSKIRFFYLIVTTSLILLSVFIAVNIASNKEKSVYNDSEAAGLYCNSSCNSWSDVYLGACDSWDKFQSGDQDCKTTSNTSRILSLNLFLQYYAYIKIQNFDPGTNCNSRNVDWSSVPSRVYSYPRQFLWDLTGGTGDKKVCVMIYSSKEDPNICCGGMIKVVASTPTPTPACKGYGRPCGITLECCQGLVCAGGEDPACEYPPTATPRPPTPTPACSNNTYRCSKDVHNWNILQKCVNGVWVTQDWCIPSNTCFCKTSPPSCYGQCS